MKITLFGKGAAGILCENSSELGMSGGLQHVGDDDVARCVHCGRPAAGPCAGCRKPVCGDCCTLTEGGTQVWAICLECDRKGGNSLAPAWRGLVLGFLGLLLALAIFAALAVLLLRP